MKISLWITLALLMCPFAMRAEPPPPPGTVIHHSPASSGLYIGSPSLCVMPDGSYLASHDLFGPASKEHELAWGRLYRSTDRGKSWSHVRDFEGFFWQGLFVHRGAAYALGTDKHHGRVVIRRSSDGMKWSEPVVLTEGEWHTAPMPVIEHGGRIWRAIEDAMGGDKWGERYRARMTSAAADSDLMKPESWSFTNPLPRDAAWLGGNFRAWLEGNAVMAPDGSMVNVLRVDNPQVPEKAAIVRISGDGGSASFDPARGFIDFDGGAKKFTIRRDPLTEDYWALATIIPERHADPALGRPSAVRNTLALVRSKDLQKWETCSILLYHPDVSRHGFQYVDWQFDGEDLIAACRTAWDDAEGGARNNHDANFITFHRWENFRLLSRKDDVPMPEPEMVKHENGELIVRGSEFEIGTLANGEKAFSNRPYVWHEVPGSVGGRPFTRLGGGNRALLEVTAKKELQLQIATAGALPGIETGGWQASADSFHYNDRSKTRLQIFTREIKTGETIRLPKGNWTGSLLILPAAP
ncbi:hypothetical protein OJ996_20890 [Luteolibacter sp. GHJ8]|uniref:Exo-alpha-sialidase n=1 Tax=Luteolibacter rhizosphaerae TaxID=2989719 RepID=A0ABT3G881_9BACT|nr:hypothetical protein [Luteolibacter rhizosphaerae]MCW1916058.1 hypothetical protein [Luteolibacter rhizosphaerae]